MRSREAATLPSSSASPAASADGSGLDGDVGIHAELHEPPERVDRHHAQRRELGATIVRQPFLRCHRAQHPHHQGVGDQDDDVEPGDQAQTVGHHVARHRQLRHDVARDPVHQRLEQQQRDQHRFDQAQAARRGIAFGQRGIDRRQPQQGVESEAEHPPAMRRVELQLAADLALRHHRRQPRRHLLVPVPDDPKQAGRDQRRIEDDGRTGDFAAGARGHERAREVMADQRQDDHPVQRHQEAARLGIVDRCDAALRRARPEPGAEQEVEGAPVHEPLESLLSELARQALGIAHLGED